MDNNILNEEITETTDISGTEPKFEIGDVVKHKIYLWTEYFVRDILISETTGCYYYEISPIKEPDISTEVFSESMLEFQYHDSNWEKYLSESVKNGLPAWRGELYNFMTLDEREWRTYKEDTLPPERMEHILNEHSFYRRVKILMKIPKMKNEIVKRMNCSEDEVEEIVESLRTKIGYYNGLYTRNVLPHRKGHDNTKFDIDENKLISVISYCDKYMHVNDENEIVKSKDHFPPYMTDYAIMKSIKEAYGSAEKIENSRSGYNREIKQKLYQGTSKDGINIQFYYDFDNNRISSAYPISVDTTNRPDLRHPGNKKTKLNSN